VKGKIEHDGGAAVALSGGDVAQSGGGGGSNLPMPSLVANGNAASTKKVTVDELLSLHKRRQYKRVQSLLLSLPRGERRKFRRALAEMRSASNAPSAASSAAADEKSAADAKASGATSANDGTANATSPPTSPKVRRSGTDLVVSRSRPVHGKKVCTKF
jgi:hypothetical protein